MDTDVVLDIEREYEMLSTAGKKAWDNMMEDFNEVSKKLGLSRKEKQAMKQRYMADLRYNDLAITNKYLSRTGEEFSQKQIKKNKLEMQRMSWVYQNHEVLVMDIEQKVSQEMEQKRQERKDTQKR